MKKRIVVYSLLLLLLTGCGWQQADATVITDEATVPTVSADIPHLITFLSGGSKRFLNVDMLVYNMTVIDRKTGDQSVICNVPGCIHNTPACEGSDCMNSSGSDICFAKTHAPTGVNVTALYNGKYVFSYCPKQLASDAGNTYLGIVNLDGSDYKEVYRWTDYVVVTNFADEVLINGHLYFSTVEEKTGEPIVEEAEDGIHTYMNIESAELCLYDLDFESEKVECLYRKHFDVDHDPYAYTVQYSDERVLLGYRYKNKTLQDIGMTMPEYMELAGKSLESSLQIEKRFDVRYDTVIYDIEKRTAQVVEDALEQRYLRAGFAGKAFYGVVTYDELYMTEVRVMDLQTQEIKSVETPWKIEYGSADFLIMRPDPSQGNDIWYMLTSDGVVHKGDFSSKGFYPLIQQEVPEMLYIAWVPIGRDSTSEEWKFEYIPREAFKALFSETVDPISGMSD